MTYTDWRRVAVHEAGHAVAHYYFQMTIQAVSISPDTGSLGHVLTAGLGKELDLFCGARIVFCDRHVSSKVARIHDRIVCAMAGAEAERLHLPNRHIREGARADLSEIMDYLVRLYPDRNELRTTYSWLRARTMTLLRLPLNRKRVLALADALLKESTLSGARVRALLGQVFP